jgi:hypothetical protein
MTLCTPTGACLNPARVSALLNHCCSHTGTSKERCAKARTGLLRRTAKILTDLRVRYTWPVQPAAGHPGGGANDIGGLPPSAGSNGDSSAGVPGQQVPASTVLPSHGLGDGSGSWRGFGGSGGGGGTLAPTAAGRAALAQASGAPSPGGHAEAMRMLNLG